MMNISLCCLFLVIVFFTATATTDIYTLSLHDALPIFFISDAFLLLVNPSRQWTVLRLHENISGLRIGSEATPTRDRKSTRLNSSHEWISYAVFCLKKKKNKSKTEDAQGNKSPARNQPS